MSNLKMDCAVIANMWHGRDKRNKAKVAHNTYAYRTAFGHIVIEYHGNGIAVLHNDGTLAHSLCGWGTSTTRTRLNQLLDYFTSSGLRYTQTDYVQYLGGDVISSDKVTYTEADKVW